MAGITGMGDTFSLPNYVGELFALTPMETPLLSAIGGLTGGGMTTATEAEWQTYDLRAPGQRGALEGATAPTAEERVRANVRNVCQIHQEKVSVSFTKQAATGQLATPGAAPFRGVPGGNPVTNELDWQTVQALKTVALDVNWSFINGLWANPTTNATARKTRGLQQAITTNVTDKSGVSYTGASSATDTITITHALSNGDKVVFTNTGAATNIVAGRVYYVVNISTTVSFKVSLTSGGAAITLGTSSANIDVHRPWTTTLTVDHLNTFVQGVYDNGGLSGMPIFHVNSSQKRAITAAYAAAYGQSRMIVPGETVAGVSVSTVLTDFGEFGIMLDRHAPQDAITALSIEQLRPFFLNTPGKGVFFEMPLALTGSSDDVMIYGEIGLEYGNEKAHGVLRGLTV
jgi:hypothetical protein